MAVLPPPPPEREHRAGEGREPAEAPLALCENEAGEKERERAGREGRSVALSVCLCLTQKSASCHRKDKLPEDLILYNNIAWPRCPSKASLTRHVLLRSFFPLQPMKRCLARSRRMCSHGRSCFLFFISVGMTMQNFYPLFAVLDTEDESADFGKIYLSLSLCNKI